jgi:hypothetical protein
MKRSALAVFALALAWILALLQRGLPLGLDEIEFFRATRWISLGQVPYLDFWEHHAPLQWLVFAPIARFASGAGAESLVLMRWAQLPMWAAILWMVITLARQASVRASGWATALLLLLLSPTFVQRAIEYRVDVLGTFCLIAALTLVLLGQAPWRWIVFGALMCSAVLANMRLAPLAAIAGLLVLFWRPDERRWRWNPGALRMAEGGLVIGIAFFAFLVLTGSVVGFVDGVIEYNRLSSHVLAVSTFRDAFLAPLWTFDLAGIAFWIAAATGVALALREIRQPGPLQVAAILSVAGIAVVAMMQVHYDYHFQSIWIVAVPLAATAIERLTRPAGRTLLIGAGVVTLILSFAQTVPTFGAAMRYQDEVMEGADRLTGRGETVFDGAGYALRRRPAWRYWFLTTGVRFLAADGRITSFDVVEMAADPPAAIIADYRLMLHLQLFPRLQAYALRHYVPVYRNLWVPGLTATIGPVPRRFIWTSPREGRYDVHVSDLLAKHPWFSRPLDYVATTGPHAPQLEIPLHRLPPYEAASLQWKVDGRVLAAGTRVIDLRKGSLVELIGSAPATAGVLLVPHGINTLCMAPEEEIVF